MLNREEINQKADRATDRLEETETKRLVSVVRQAKPDDSVNRENIREWHARKQTERTELMRRNLAIAQADLPAVQREMAKIVDEVIEETTNRQDSFMADVVPGINIEVPRFTPGLEALAQTQRSETIGTLNLIVQTMLTQSQQVYADILAEVVQMVIDRLLSPQEALVEVAGRWAERG